MIKHRYSRTSKKLDEKCKTKMVFHQTNSYKDMSSKKKKKNKKKQLQTKCKTTKYEDSKQ